MAAGKSGTLRNPYPAVTTSNDASGNGNASISPTRKSGAARSPSVRGRLFPRELDHPARDIEANDFPSGRGQPEGDVAGARREIEGPSTSLRRPGWRGALVARQGRQG